MNQALQPVSVEWKWSSSPDVAGEIGGQGEESRASDSTASQVPEPSPGSCSGTQPGAEPRNSPDHVTGRSGGSAVPESGEVSSSPVVGRSAAPCPRCGRHEHWDVPIHDGASTRRDCARCHRFISFPVWYGKDLQWEGGRLCE